MVIGFCRVIYQRPLPQGGASFQIILLVKFLRMANAKLHSVTRIMFCTKCIGNLFIIHMRTCIICSLSVMVNS